MEPFRLDSRPFIGSLSGAELLRKLLHMGVGVLAFTLVFLNGWGTVLLATGLLGFNLFLFPRLGSRRLWRPDEVAQGVSVGIPSYPLALLVLALLFWGRPEVIAPVWGILALGDGMATLVGRAFGGAPLPWNRQKTWLGSLAGWLCGGLAAFTLLVWTQHHQERTGSLWFLVLVAASAALVAAFLESQPQGLDDNLLVPPITALCLWAGLQAESFFHTANLAALELRLVLGALANLLLAGVAFRARSVSLSGAVAGVVLGTLIWVALDWRGFLVLGAFFVFGSVATRLGYSRKERGQLAQESGGRRGAKNALANAGVATGAAIFALITPYPEMFTAAFVGAFAAALGDTLSSEIGQLGRGRPRLITTLEAVPPGTNGAISRLGTGAGILGSAAIAGLGGALGLYPPPVILGITLAGLAGNLVDSLLGATLEKRGLLDNEGVNFLNTLAGALVGGGWVAMA